MDLSNRPAFIVLPYGISYDQKNLMQHLDKEVPFIDKADDELIDLATEEIELEPDILFHDKDEDENDEVIGEAEYNEE